MKKIMKVATGFLMCFLLILSAEVSLAVEASLYDSGSGTTTAPSGVSVFALSSDKYTIDDDRTIINLNKFRPFKTIALRLDSIDLPSGVTFGQAADTDDGTVDDDEYQIYARISNDIDTVSTGQRFPLISPTEYKSSTSPYLIYWVPPPSSYARLEFVSGVSAIREANIDFTPYDIEYDATLVVFDTQHSVFATTGVSNNMTSGGTGFTIPDGATWCGFFANGDDVPYSTDDTDATTLGYYFPESQEKLLPVNEIRQFGTAANGNSAGTLSMTPYSHKPY